MKRSEHSPVTSDGGRAWPSDPGVTMPERRVPTPAEERTVVDHARPTRSAKSFGEHLDEIRADVIKLAALTGEQIGAGTQALLDADLANGGARDRDDSAKRRSSEDAIEFRVYELFATQQPMAVDLRTLLAVLRILQEIQLTGDLTVTIAKATRRLYPRELPPKIRGLIEQMGAQASDADEPRDRRLRRPRSRDRAPRSPTWTT